MGNEILVILDFSPEIEDLLERQSVDVYDELQREMPELRIEHMPDPEAPTGTKDIATVILALASLASALTPLIIRILNQCTPPNRSSQVDVEELETRYPDGRTIIQRKRIRFHDEQHPWTSLPYPNAPSSTPSPNASGHKS
jgi:hypothetical protein